MDKSKVKAIVFDLDGTLYEDTHHFDYYANQLEKRITDNHKADFRDDYELSIVYKHPMQVGRIYDVKRDLILVTDNGYVKKAFEWNGTQLNKELINELYPDQITYDFHSMLNCGDIWWVLISIATHYGLDGKESNEAFLETRSFMMCEDFIMKPIPGLKQMLNSLKDNHIDLFMLTNSPEPDSEAILKKLKIDELFSKKFFNGNKPISTQKWFEEIQQHYHVPFDEILSVGDNLINEIDPARQLGCQTILIDTHGVNKGAGADYIVRNMSEALPIIAKLTKITE
ncbi:HAD family hydrolase [Calidifontibacillus oryziterrae]|uniref:HAD family hydrolase n=1 Tax=Calidifontibacillus oryziterrae TaxID=1191699 RepID=UPI0002F6A9AA|nr:HAD family hydrolase [Calidifontibacillus oryziterrae]